MLELQHPIEKDSSHLLSIGSYCNGIPAPRSTEDREQDKPAFTIYQQLKNEREREGKPQGALGAGASGVMVEDGERGFAAGERCEEQR